jgi:hypothetical protein
MQAAIEQWQSLTNATNTYVAEGVVTPQSDFITNELAANGASEEIVINLQQGNIEAPFVWANDLGGYLWAPSGTGNNFTAGANDVGLATYTVNIPTAGSYKFNASVSAPSNSDNSFFFSMDGGAFTDWHCGVNGGFTNQIVTRTAGQQDLTYNLTAGNHTLVIKQREDGTRLQSLSVLESDGGGSVLPPGIIYLDFELNELLGVPNSVLFRVKFRDYDEFSYQLYDPEIISNYNINVQNIKVLINNYYNPQHSTYTLVDKLVTPQDTIVSPYSMILLKDQGNNLDKISFEFLQISVID